jgi:hypothetical protein
MNVSRSTIYAFCQSKLVKLAKEIVKSTISLLKPGGSTQVYLKKWVTFWNNIIIHLMGVGGVTL